MIRKCMNFTCPLFILLLLSSCIKDYCSLSEQKIRTIRILPSWAEGSKKPEGIRVVLYAHKNGKYVQDNFLPEGGTMNIREGNYATIMYNNDSETIFFRKNTEYKTFEAYTKHISRPSFVNPVPEEDTFDQPDFLWADNHDTIEVSDVSLVISFYPQQLVKEYIGFIYVEGMEQVQAVRGAITGMMGSCVLSTKRTKDKSATIFFDADKASNGIHFKFRSFGIFQEDDISRKHYLTIEFLLPNSIARQNINITSQVDSLINGGILQFDKTIVLPPDTTGGDGGIDADVGKWDEIIYPIPI